MLLMEENQQPAGWWSDLVDNNPPSGSIDGNYATSVTVFKIFVFAITPVAYSNYLANIILLPNGKEKERAGP